MAEVKNAFIKSKMNKDLDDRLIPSGEYREGINIQVSKSEGADVGALENVLGNEIALDASQPPNNVDFNILSNCGCELKSIGTYVDNSNSIIYIFLTDYTDNSIGNFTYNNSANNFIYSYNTNTRQVVKLIEGPFLNFSTKNPIYGVNLLENLLFWTDNRNQPRKLNINLANNGLFYTTEDKISVAKYNPYECINLYYEDIAATTPIGDANPNENKFVTSMQDVTSEFLPDVTTKNPYYNPLWPGDPDFLEDKFVRFSYRFKFVDGEYSILAPFTQDCFIPKQDGYFLTGDESAAYRSTIVQFMENKVNNIILNIPLPYTVATLYNNLNIEEIDIVYKESDGLAVKVLDTIIRSEFQGDNTPPSTNLYYNYDYQSRKPYRTLPDSEITRVYDKVPVRAFSQEMISNRVVYGNFQTKHTPPASLNYDVAVSPKLDFLGPETGSGVNPALWYTSVIEYPEHTVKQNRNYQIGFVLADRYGRSSTTILSSVNEKITTSGGFVFGGSTYYHPYRKSTDINSATWHGDSIKVLLNQEVKSFRNILTGTPGLYNGDITSDSYNPLGWYSYKIVVKQTEQDYYNAYLPGILNGYPSSAAVTDPFPTNEDNKTAHIVLLNDNINKIPRDLSEVGPDQKQYRSSVQLYGRVNNNTATTNVQYYPGIETDTVSTIANSKDLDMFIESDIPNATSGLNAEGQANLYQIATNPMIGRVSTPTVIGTLNAVGASNMQPKLAVYETKSTDSLLDIFWETSTSGTIKDLNNSVGAITQIDKLEGWNFTQTEASLPTNSIAGIFYPVREIGQINPTPVVLSSIDVWEVLDSNNNVVTDNWTLETISGGQFVYYELKVNETLYYQPDINLNHFTFTFQVTDKKAVDPNDWLTFEFQEEGTLVNIVPTITTVISGPIIKPRGTQGLLQKFEAINGCENTTFNKLDLTWTLDKATSELTGGSIPINDQRNALLALDPVSGELSAINATLEGAYKCIISVTDSGGVRSTPITIDLMIGTAPLNLGFGKSNNNILEPFTISTGAQSASVYWQVGSSINEPSLPNPYNDPYDNGDITWDPIELTGSSYSSIAKESNTQMLLTNEDNTVSKFPQGDQQFYLYKNTLYRPDYFGSTAVPSGVTTGTAFIVVECEIQQQPYVLNTDPTRSDNRISPVVGWPVFLQYRSDAGGTWTTATDVEGQAIRFGGSAYSQYDREPNPIQGIASVNSKYENFKTSGIIQDSTTGTNNGTWPVQGANFGQTSGEDIMALKLDQPFPVTMKDSNSNSTPVTSQTISGKIQKTFVFGTDQGYENLNNNKLGEYRLFVVYPYSINGQIALGSTQPFGQTARPSLSQNYSQTFPITAPDKNNPESEVPKTWKLPGDENIKVSIAFGDFYYSTGGRQNTAYRYRVSKDGSTDRSIAKDIEFTTESQNSSLQATVFYAVEWACKYVTKFYTDEAMTIVHIPSNGFYAYAPLDAGLVSKYGTNFSFFQQSTTTPLTNPQQADSRWTAYFSNGIKDAGSAEPNVE